ncbi:MAG: cytochrome c-type bioproteinis protein [Candidatus Saganbacteria bacterium]|uniref:Cytochrome c-type bioproteinis protein n=1 Tax=Candidatus Saganbacteria bacterium TaxID=2575572 RepID=A0A833NWE9_UNCSA|nr:MAG: cytochrome c-type bioproteinis protein [Candidatus Saganbacteria bacterium]
MMDFSNPFIAYAAVFFGGIIASFSPCVLPMIPIILGFVGGYSEGNFKRTLLLSLLFSLGLAVTFSIMGIIASLTGSLLGDVSTVWKYILSIIAIVMGLNLIGIININYRSIVPPKIIQKGFWSAFVLGLFFGLAFSPCSTPILAVLLTFVASRRNLFYGASLLLVYSLAYTFTIFMVGLFFGFIESTIKSNQFNKVIGLFRKASGMILIISGIIIWFR